MNPVKCAVWKSVGEFSLHPFLRAGCHPKCAVETVILPEFENAEGESLVLEVGEVFETIRASPSEGLRIWMIEVFRNNQNDAPRWRFHFRLDEQEPLISVFATYPPTLTAALEELPSSIRFAGHEAYVYRKGNGHGLFGAYRKYAQIAGEPARRGDRIGGVRRGR